MNAETLDIMIRVVERMDLQLAAIARAGIDLTDGQTAPEAHIDQPAQLDAQPCEFRVSAVGRRLGDNAGAQGLLKDTKHRLNSNC